MSISRVIKVLRSGGIACFPTDTVYALAVDPRNVKAVDKLCLLKKRDRSKPISILVRSESQILQYIHMARNHMNFVSSFKKGSITVIGTPVAEFPFLKNINARESLGVRVPYSPFIRGIIMGLGHPIAATSANLSGKQAACSECELPKILRMNCSVVKGCDVCTGKASTVVDLQGKVDPTIVRS